jgi:hypothetical protein
MVKGGTKQPVAQVERYTQRVVIVAQQDSFVAKVAACVLSHFVPALEKVHGLDGRKFDAGRAQVMARALASGIEECCLPPSRVLRKSSR